MRTLTTSLKIVPLLLAPGIFTGCESTDGGGSGATTMYYGVGIYDPWYYGTYDDATDIIVTPPRPGDRPEAPPPSRPERPLPPPRPEQPIARPKPEPRLAPQPMPSIPSMPRPSFRR